MRGKLMLYRDQWGNFWYAKTVAELRRKIGGGRVSKMFIDTKDGTVMHVGYVVGPHWCDAYVPFAAPAP